MAMKITQIDVWAAEIADRSGGLADVLEALARAGASLDAVLARRTPEKPGGGVVFVTPVKGKKAQDAARDAGFSPATDVGGLRVEGADKPGLGGRIARAIADAGISMRGFNAAALGNKFVAHIGFDSAADAARAAQAVRGMSAPRGRRTTAAARAKPRPGGARRPTARRRSTGTRRT